MLETFIVLNKKDIEKAKGKVEPIAPRGKRVGREERKKIPFEFFICFFFQKQVNAWVASQEVLV